MIVDDVEEVMTVEDRQIERDLPDRASRLDVGVKDPAHDLGLGLEDLDPRRPAVGRHHTPMAV